MEFAAEKLADSKKTVIDMLVDYVRVRGEGGDSLAIDSVPGYLQESGKLGEVISYLSPEYFERFLKKSGSFRPLWRQFKAGMDAAERLRQDGELFRFTLAGSAISEIGRGQVSRAEIEARVTVGLGAEALALATNCPLMEDRLHLLAVVARAEKERGSSVGDDVLGQIRRLRGQVDARSLGERGIDIAADLFACFPDLAIGLVEECAGKGGFERNAAIAAAKEVVNENDETRKRFEIMARTVFRRFRACLTVQEVHLHRSAYDAINIVYKSLQADRDKTDISQIIRELHAVVGESISPAGAGQIRESPASYDISAIDFERLRQEFARSTTQNTHVQNLKGAIERRLARMLAQNPLRTDFQRHYENLVADYNREKDRVTIEKTFEALLKFVAKLDVEQERALREGLDEHTLALFDLLKKAALTPADIKRIKRVAVDLYARLRDDLARIRDWEQKQATRDQVKQTIRDFLYSDETGLPESYSEDEIKIKSDLIFGHFLTQQQHGLALAAG